jgi:hypothetical protein
MWVIPQQETAVACSRNSPPSPPALAPRCFIVPLASRQGSRRQVINPSPFLPQLQLPPSCLPAPAPVLLAILSLASVSIHTSAGHPSRNSPPLSSAGFLRFGKSQNLDSNTPVQSWVSPFPSFGNLILVQADASFSACLRIPNPAFTGQLHVKMRCLLLILKPTWHDIVVIHNRPLQEHSNASAAPLPHSRFFLLS